MHHTQRTPRRHASMLARAAIVVALVALMAPAFAAGAARHVIGANGQPANQPSLGPGIYLANIPGGYYMGRLLQNQTFDRNLSEIRSNGSEYHFGYAVGEVGNCLWLGPPQSIDNWRGYLNSSTYVGQVGDRCFTADKDKLVNRSTFVGHANCPEYKAKGPMKVTLLQNATFYWSIDWDSSFYGGSAGAARGTLDAFQPVWYRYTTRSGYWSVVYSGKYRTWGFIPSSRLRDIFGNLPSGQWGYAGSDTQYACGSGPLG